MSPQAITPTAPQAPSGSPTAGFRPAPGSSPATVTAAPVSPAHRHWVISDVHGCADSLLELIGLLPPDDRVVLCGDVINRGPRIEAAMELAWHLVTSGRGVWLMGNHEQRLIHQLRGEACCDRHLLAGSDTYRQLGGRSCRRWLERLEQLPLVHRGEGWAATHAGFDPLTWQPHLTVRMAFWQLYDGRFGTVIVGHTPGPQVRRIRDIVLIDTGACYGGPLTAYCAETGDVRSVAGLPAPRQPHHPWTIGSTGRLAGSVG